MTIFTVIDLGSDLLRLLLLTDSIGCRSLLDLAIGTSPIYILETLRTSDRGIHQQHRPPTSGTVNAVKIPSPIELSQETRSGVLAKIPHNMAHNLNGTEQRKGKDGKHNRYRGKHDTCPFGSQACPPARAIRIRAASIGSLIVLFSDFAYAQLSNCVSHTEYCQSSRPRSCQCLISRNGPGMLQI